MTSPDRQRLAAALAKLDDPHIIGLLLEAFQAPTTPDPTPEPTQPQLIEDITPRPIARNVGRRWTTNQLYQLRAMVNGGNSVDEIARHFGRTESGVKCAIERHIHHNPTYSHQHRRNAS